MQQVRESGVAVLWRRHPGVMIERLQAFGEAHHALITRSQAISLGCTSDDIRSFRRMGLLDRPARGVYRFAGSVPTWRQQLLIAIYAAGEGAVASGLAAPALWRLPGFPEGPVDVLQRRGASARSRVANLHQTLLLPPHHVTEIDAIPVLRPARMLFDVCAIVHPKRAERAVDNGLAMDLTTLPRLEVILAECAARGRGGTAVLRWILDERGEGYVPPASELEALVLAVLAGGGLPAPVRQRSVGGTTAPVGRIDLLYPPPRFVIEADSRRHHSSWLDVVADHQRDAKLLAAGYQILRVTWHQLVHEPQPFLEAVEAVLARAA